MPSAATLIVCLSVCGLQAAGVVSASELELQPSVGVLDSDIGQQFAQQSDSKLLTTSDTKSLSSFPSLIIDPMAYDEPYDAGWQVYFDNDLFTGTDRDRDYTGGFALAYSGRRAREWIFSMDTWLDHIDEIAGIQSLQFDADGFLRHTFEFGLVLFTPVDLSESAPLPEDHPYSNFLFVANSQQVTFPKQRWVLQSALTLGLVGTGLGPEFQNSIHSATGSEEANGWGNQISDGGELTGKYSVVGHKNLISQYNRFSYEFTGSVEGNIGFNTDLGISMAARLGQLKSPWWSFVPHQSDYINLGQTITGRIDERTLPAELFVWTGVKAKYIAYNGFLQGQFRDSAVTFDRDELENVTYEGWLGVTKTWNSGIGLSFFVRRRTGEIKGSSSRNPIWSGFIINFTS